MRSTKDKPGERLFTFRSGGWVLALSALGILLVLGSVLLRLGRQRAERIGDGKNVETYRFDLETTLVPRDEIVAAGMYRDKLTAFVNPTVWTLAEHEQNRSPRGRTMLVPGNRVIGAMMNGEARAYPVSILNWHEVVNDTLGDQEIVVTYHPLCDSAAVFFRKLGDEVLTFGVSGLLWQSNQLLYDRREVIGTESLWSQLQARAIAGPAAEEGLSLQPIPFEYTTWEDWSTRHPEPTVLAPDPVMARDYLRKPYLSSYAKQELRFPADPYPPPGELPPWSRIAVVPGPDGERRPVPLPPSDRDPRGTVPGARPILFHSFLWAWHATR